MLSSSKDVLLLVSAICVAMFTFFTCWGLYYLVGMLRNVFKISKDAGNILVKTEETIDAIKNKINSSSSQLFMISQAVKGILDITDKMKAKEGFGFHFGKKAAGNKNGEEESKAENIKVEEK